MSDTPYRTSTLIEESFSQTQPALDFSDSYSTISAISAISGEEVNVTLTQEQINSQMHQTDAQFVEEEIDR